ncbi:DUF6153 family protein [Streptomyces wuyuanensis]|uniref:Uncharacterized protein n=1 Tax=Streptomyces wuyuanensis TaxID=1196353 RepID=A0A1G9N8A8_9ACTN|nr:DUF6153 family protein [Streptomyces wuyuanensis]SDL82105.1 hypothetical protein SAMN05444921_101504 [Streptomyces wuyuanensis]
MTRRTTSHARPAGRGLALLVLAVLAGVLGMHALAPAGVPGSRAQAHGAVATVHTAPVQAAPLHTAPVQAAPVHASPVHGQTVPEPSVAQAGPGCSHTDGGADHLGHADGTCAAAGVGSPYAPPEPAPALGAPPSVATPSGAGRTPPSGRAPPDLAELQLLRI